MKLEDLRVHLLAAKTVSPDPADWWGPGWSSPPNRGSALPLKVLYASWNYLGFPRVPTRFDIVHATGLVVPPAKAGRLVATVHDVAVDVMPDVVPGSWRRIYAKGLRVALAEARILCAVSDAVKAQLLEMYSVDHNRIVVTPEAANVTPSDFRDNSSLDKLGIQGPYVLTVGTVEPRKNQILLLEAFSEAGSRLKDVQLVIAGSPGWGSDRVSRAIHRLGLERRVIVTGSVGASALAALYGRAAVFAMPSLYEGFGIPLVEAMGFGLPCLASLDPALKEVGGEGAIFADAKDTGAWSNELVRLTHDDDLRNSLSAKARNRAAEFSWQKTAAATLDAYRRAAAA